MKIFNWVHRRFHQKDEVGQDMKKAEFVKNDIITDTLALLEHVALPSGFDGWKEGLLTIGTLGFDHPLKELGNFKQQKESILEQDYYYYSNNYQVDDEDLFGDEDECDCETDDDGEMDPLVFKAFKHGFDSRIHDNIANATMEGTHGHAACTDDLSSNRKSIDEEAEYRQERKKRGERITLADLFSADSEMKKVRCGKAADQATIISKKLAPDYHAKIKRISFSKMFIPRVKQDSRPIHKLHKLMTKMLKRKIHPDLQSKETQLVVLNNDGHGSTESVSLLQTQVVVT